MLNISVGGDAAGGYLVDVHDGTKSGVYRPDAADDHEAFAAALKEHDPELAGKISAVMGGDPEDAKRIAALEAEVSDSQSQRQALQSQVDHLTADLAKARAPSLAAAAAPKQDAATKSA